MLKGPQGALFGRNTLGGAVSLVSKGPSSEFGGRISLEAGNYGLLALRFAVTGPLREDKITYRLSFATRRQDGYVENLLSGIDHDGADGFGGRGQLRFLGKRSDALLILDWSEDDVNALPLSNVTDQVFLLYPPLAGTFPVSDDPYRQFYDTDGFQKRHHGGIALRWRWTGERTTFTSLTSLRSVELTEHHDLDASAAYVFHRFADEDSETLSQELRLASNGEPGATWSWLAGLFYSRDDASRIEIWDLGADNSLTRVFNGGVPYFTVDDHSVDVESAAVFGQLRWAFRPRWHLTMGAPTRSSPRSCRRPTRRRPARAGRPSILRWRSTSLLGTTSCSTPVTARASRAVASSPPSRRRRR